jgi:hypothetical protein
MPSDPGREAGGDRPAEVERRDRQERRGTSPERRSGRAALSLYGVTFSEGLDRAPAVAGVELVVVRELAALAKEAPYASTEPTDEQVLDMAETVRAFATRAAVLPAPIGVVFRSREAVQRWVELHYVALSDALSFVDDRLVGRVHVWRPGATDEQEVGSDLAATAAESLRELRRSAVASVPLRVEQITGIVLSAAFLVDQELWKEFAAKVQDLDARTPSIRLELTGPWPPYDFVQMRFGS